MFHSHKDKIAHIYEMISAGATLAKVCKEFGGQNLYIPKISPEAPKKIVEEFNGGNHYVLAERYNCSIAYVYKIIQLHHQKRLAK